MKCCILLSSSLLFSVLLQTSFIHSLNIQSICTGLTSQAWNTDKARIGQAVHSWLQSVVTVGVEGRGGGQSMLYHPHTAQFGQHFAHFNDIMEENDHLVDEEKRVVTIGTFTRNIPSGLTWQWRSKRMTEGFLYGEVDR